MQLRGSSVARRLAALGVCVWMTTAALAQTKPADSAKDAAGKAAETGKGAPADVKASASDAAAKAGDQDIVDTAMAAGKFNTLISALKAAGLIDTLKGPGPFTVFAPTDEAFAKIPKEELSALMADTEELKAVLTYHVVPGKFMAADVAKMKTAKTVHGEELTIDTTAGSVMVDEANVVQTDIVAKNGVIHAIDTVLLGEEQEGGE